MSTQEEAIKKYFETLPQGYPPIKECSTVLVSKHGTVYLVKFKKKPVTRDHNTSFDRPTTQNLPPSEMDIPNAYAIVVDEQDYSKPSENPQPRWSVAGYNEDFWSSADKYRLVLKQHLGMLAMEAAEKPKVVELPKQEVKPDAPAGTVRTETMDAVVTRYEEMLAQQAMQWEKEAHESNAKIHELQIKLADAEARLDTAKRALDGEPLFAMPKPEPETPESVMIQVDGEDSGEPIADRVGIEELSKYEGSYRDIPGLPKAHPDSNRVIKIMNGMADAFPRPVHGNTEIGSV